MHVLVRVRQLVPEPVPVHAHSLFFGLIRAKSVDVAGGDGPVALGEHEDVLAGLGSQPHSTSSLSFARALFQWLPCFCDNRGLSDSSRAQIPFEYQKEVIRSAITLKVLTFEETGSVIGESSPLPHTHFSAPPHPLLSQIIFMSPQRPRRRPFLPTRTARATMRATTGSATGR
jgi:hypothetical protein